MDLTDYEAPRVLVTCRRRQIDLSGDQTDIVPLYYHIVDDFQIQFGREEFCLVTGLKFGVEYSDQYDNDEAPIPFRRRVFSSVLDACLIRMLTLDVGIPFMLLSREEGLIVHILTYSLFGFTWAFKGSLPIARLTPDDNEARSEWWLSSRAYFDGVISVAEPIPRHLNRQNLYEIPLEFYREFKEQKRAIEAQKKVVEQMIEKEGERKEMYEEMRRFMESIKVDPSRQTNKGPIIVDEHFGLSDFSEFASMQTQESKIDRVKKLDADLVDTNIRTIYDEEPMAEVQLTTECNIFAIGQQHIEQPEIIVEEHCVEYMSKENVTLKQHYKDLYDSIKITRSKTTEQTTSLLANNAELKAQIQEKVDSYQESYSALALGKNILNRERREQRPNIYLRTPFMKLPPTTVLPKKRGDRAKNKVKNANLSPLNLGNVFANDNVGDDDVMFLGGRFTGH
ncbi:hypothetical protein Tco_1498892 [Tanacetum coccineum]